MVVNGRAVGVGVLVRRGGDGGGNGERGGDGGDGGDRQRAGGSRLVAGPEVRRRGDDGHTCQHGRDGVGESGIFGLLQPVDPRDPDEASRDPPDRGGEVDDRESARRQLVGPHQAGDGHLELGDRQHDEQHGEGGGVGVGPPRREMDHAGRR